MAVEKWGLEDAPALRTIANALREVRKADSTPVSVESEPLTAGECPECLGYGKFWQAAVWIRGDQSIHSMAKDHHLFPADGKPTIRVSPDERNMDALGRQDCKRCFGTGYIGTPATRTPVWEEPEEEALEIHAPKECPECLGEIWDDECQCPVEEAEADPPEVAVPTPTDTIVDQLIEDAANDPTVIVSDDVAERVNPAPPEILVDMDLSGMNLPDMPKFVTSNEVEL
jgi:hypothetical protein